VSDEPQSWYRLVVKTVGLMATVNLGQPFDFTGACNTCGAGAVPISPLFIDSVRMGKKALDLTAHDGRLVVSRELGDQLRAAALTGLNFLPVAHKTESRLRPAARFEWLEPSFEWPRLDPSSVLAREDRCTSCGRSGHFDSPSPPTTLRYATAPVNAPDFGATFEYFGRWRAPGRSAPNVGGARLLIVSNRFKAVLATARVRHVAPEPVQILRRDA